VNNPLASEGARSGFFDELRKVVCEPVALEDDDHVRMIRGQHGAPFVTGVIMNRP